MSHPFLTSTRLSAVVIFLRPVGNAPILKQAKFKISSSSHFQAVDDFLQRQIWGFPASPTAGQDTSAPPKAPLYLYVNSSFAPAPDEIIGNLFACFAVDSTLIINYSLIPAWT